jgi:hypothetical protein
VSEEREPIEETTETSESELHVEAERIVITTDPDGTRTVEASDAPEEETSDE